MITTARSRCLLSALLFAALCSSCSFWSGSDTKQPDSGAIIGSKSRIPFETKEPEIYRCEIVVTTFGLGKKSERIVKAARNGSKLRYIYPSGVSFLKTGEGENYLIQTEARIYVASSKIPANLSKNGVTFEDFPTTEWLNKRIGAKFESLGAEKGLAKFRVVLDESIYSEIVIFVDENYRLPVKQEYYSIDGSQKTLVSVIELRDIRLETDDTMFELPKEFKQVTLNEFQEVLRMRQK